MAKLYEIKNEFNELLLMADEQGLSLDDIKDTMTESNLSLKKRLILPQR